MAAVPKDCISHQAKLQHLRWILALRQSENSKLNPSFRARHVSASHRSKYGRAFQVSAPSVALSTMRTFFEVLLSWMQSSRSDRFHTFTRTVTKAHLQSDLLKRFTYYRPSSEFFKVFSQYCSYISGVKLHFYGDVEGGLYWHKISGPWFLEDISGLKQSIYDPCFLYSSSEAMPAMLCSHDTLVAAPF